MAQNCIWLSKASQACEHSDCHCDVAACGISSKNYVIKIHSELLLGLCNNPDVCLITIIDWIGVRVFRSESVVNAKDRNVKTYCPLPGVHLVGS